MIILGIEEDHNGTAAVMRDGKVIAAISKERLSRKKNDTGYSRITVDKCLELAGVTPEEIDVVAVSSLFQNLAWIKIKRMSLFSVSDFIGEQYNYFKPLILENAKIRPLTWKYINVICEEKEISPTDVDEGYDYTQLNEENCLDPHLSKELRIKAITNHLNIDPQKIKFIEHHSCHSYYSYYSSPFRTDTLVITADGIGDGLNATINTAKGNVITRVHHTNNCQIGRIYRYITLLLGMKPFQHEYKVMGLAPYANSHEVERAYKVFSRLFTINGLDWDWNEKPSDLYFHFKEHLEGCRFDGIAGALQKMVEELFVQWVKNAISETGIRQIVFGGGVAMNIKLNKAIAEIPEVENFFVGASSSDESNAIGACYYVMDKYCEEKGISKTDHIQSMKDSYLGTEITSQDVEKAIDNCGVRDKYLVEKGVSKRRIAEELAQGKVVGLCWGRMEFGARALGNRSIIADPSNASIIKKINSQIKFRDFWMPFTPSILYERAEDYLVNPKKIYSPFMTIGFDSTPKAQNDIIAGLHPSDLTARPQMVKKEVNPNYYDLIHEFQDITGIGGVLNTSLNLHGLPIVCSPEDAIEVMEGSQLDMMYFGDLLLSRKLT